MARPFEIGKGSRFVILASICIVVAALYLAQEVLVPLALALLFAFLLTPLVARLESLKLGRGLSVLIVVVLSLGVVGGIGWLMGHQILSIAQQLPTYRSEIESKFRWLRGSADSTFNKASKNMQGLAEEFARPVPPSTTQSTTQSTTAPTTAPAQARQIEAIPAGADTAVKSATDRPRGTPVDPIFTKLTPEALSPVKTVGEWIAAMLRPTAMWLLVIVFVIFMLAQREDLRDRMLRLVGQGQVNLTTQALDDAASRISRYLVSQAIVNAIYGVAVGVGLFTIGRTLGDRPFPNALLWGLLCGILRFIPYVGPWIGAAMPILLSLVFPGMRVFAATAIMFVVLELFVSQWVEPLMYGSSTGMSALAVLASAVFWTWLWGPIGLLLSTPLTVCLVVIGKHVPQLQFLDILLGDEPVLEPPVRVYQRLVSMDEEEATELADEYLADHTLEQLYDDVLIPALSMAEHDHHRGKLDDARHAFTRQAMRGIIEEMGERHAANEEEAKEKAASEDAKEPRRKLLPAFIGRSAEDSKPDGNGKAPPEPPPPRPRLPRDCVINVLCLPARDEADEILCLMLSQLLELQGYHAIPASVTKLAGEMLEMVEQSKAHTICVSAMPPAAVTHSRYLCKRLHGRFPDIKMIVGLWTARGDLKKAKARLTCGEAVRLVSSLAQALEQIHQIAQPLILADSESPAPASA